MRPHATSHIRLLRPFSHPQLSTNVNATNGMTFHGQATDAVFVDRLWRPDISPSLAKGLVQKVKESGARLLYSLDDNLFLAKRNVHGWPSPLHLQVVEYFLRNSDGVLVTTKVLRDYLSKYNQRIAVIPNALDERLLVNPGNKRSHTFSRSDKTVIGYMGTQTHSEDFRVIMPVIKEILRKYSDRVELQILGVVDKNDDDFKFGDLPVRWINPLPEESEYPSFMLWFTSKLKWDIAIAPLEDNEFNRFKSDIKFLDYSSLGAVGIFSDLEPYRSSVKHLETGWLAKNEKKEWSKALETLIEDVELRKIISENATRNLLQNRILIRCVEEWLRSVRWILS
jgi:glycosyltransferase involved in cell wall biosynthesis